MLKLIDLLEKMNGVVTVYDLEEFETYENVSYIDLLVFTEYENIKNKKVKKIEIKNKDLIIVVVE